MRNIKIVRRQIRQGIIYVVAILLYSMAGESIAQTPSQSIDRSKSLASEKKYIESLEVLDSIEAVSQLSNVDRNAIIQSYRSLLDEAIDHSSRKVAYQISESAGKRFQNEKTLLIKIGKANLGAEEYKKSIGQLGNFIVLEGGKSNDKESKALAYTAQGYGLMQTSRGSTDEKKNIEMAIEQFKNSLKVDSDWYLPYFMMGQAYTGIADYKNARVYFEEGMKRNQQGFSYMDYVLLGSIYNELKEYQLTVSLLREISKEHPYWPAMHYLLGNAYSSMGQLSESFFEYNYELFIAGPAGPFSGPTAKEIVKVSKQLLGAGDTNDKFKDAIFCVKALTAEGNGDFNQAINLLNNAIASNKESNPLVYLFLAEAYMKNKQIDESIVYFKKIIERDPYFPPAYSELGDVYEIEGNYEEAAYWWRRALKTDPNNWKVKESKDKLDAKKVADQPEQFEHSDNVGVAIINSKEKSLDDYYAELGIKK